MTQCLYHLDKDVFDKVTRDLQKSKILPTSQSKRLAMCVCACRRNRFNLATEATLGELCEMAEFLDGCIKTENWPTSVVSLLRSELQDISLDNYSACVLVMVLYRAIKLSDYGLLESMMRKNMKKDQRKVQHKMTAVQFTYMMNRKWKKSAHKVEFVVPLFAGNTKRFENDENVKKLKENHKGVLLRVCHTENGKFMEENVKKMKIVLAGNDENEIRKVGQEMITIGHSIQKDLDDKRTAKFERRKVYRTWRADYLAPKDPVERNLTQLSLDHKDSLQDLYVRKVESNKIGNGGKAKSSLKDGHCMNCLDTFTSLKDDKECKYHPGFIGLDSKWTCCDKESEVDHPTFQVHADTGCTTGLHNWRQGKSSKKKHKNSCKLSNSPKSSSSIDPDDWI